MRMLLKEAFSKRAMQRWEEDIIRPIVDEHLRALLPVGHADLYAEVAAKVPTLTIAAGLGLPSADRASFFDWAVQMTSPAATPAERLAAAGAVAEYVAPIIEERRAAPGDDLISMLVTAEISGEDRRDYDGATHQLSNSDSRTSRVRAC